MRLTERNVILCWQVQWCCSDETQCAAARRAYCLLSALFTAVDRSVSQCPVISIQQVRSVASIFSTQPAAAAAAAEAMLHVQISGTLRWLHLILRPRQCGSCLVHCTYIIRCWTTNCQHVAAISPCHSLQLMVLWESVLIDWLIAWRTRSKQAFEEIMHRLVQQCQLSQNLPNVFRVIVAQMLFLTLRNTDMSFVSLFYTGPTFE